MDFNSLLLLVALWLLWTIHLDLAESNDRQRSLKTSVNQLISRLEQLLGSNEELATPVAEAIATVNLNSASKAQLQTLPRIGAVSAQQIIAARPYTSIEAVQEVQGISKSIYAGIKDRVSV